MRRKNEHTLDRRSNNISAAPLWRMERIMNYLSQLMVGTLIGLLIAIAGSVVMIWVGLMMIAAAVTGRYEATSEVIQNKIKK